MTEDQAFGVAWSPTARREVGRLPEKVAAAAIELVYVAIAENPHRTGHRLRFELEGLHSARRGGYRVVYRIDDDDRLVTVMTIEHRSKVYRSR